MTSTILRSTATQHRTMKDSTRTLAPSAPSALPACSTQATHMTAPSAPPAPSTQAPRTTAPSAQTAPSAPSTQAAVQSFSKSNAPVSSIAAVPPVALARNAAPLPLPKLLPSPKQPSTAPIAPTSPLLTLPPPSQSSHGIRPVPRPLQRPPAVNPPLDSVASKPPSSTTSSKQNADAILSETVAAKKSKISKGDTVGDVRAALASELKEAEAQPIPPSPNPSRDTFHPPSDLPQEIHRQPSNPPAQDHATTGIAYPTYGQYPFYASHPNQGYLPPPIPLRGHGHYHPDMYMRSNQPYYEYDTTHPRHGPGPEYYYLYPPPMPSNFRGPYPPAGPRYHPDKAESQD